MYRAIALLTVTLVPLLIGVACGGDGGDETEGTATATPTEVSETTPVSTETPEATSTAAATPQTTPADVQTPEAGSTEEPQDGTATTPAPGEAKPAIMAADQAGFTAQFGDVRIAQKTCDYDQDSGLADCGADGLYQLQDAIQGSEATCRVMLIDDQPVGLNCQTGEPVQGIFYTID